MRRVDEFSDLKNGSPHRSSTTRDRRLSDSVVEQLVTDDRTTESKQSQSNSTDEENSRSRFVQNGEIRNGVARRTRRAIESRLGGRGRRSGESDLLEDGDIFTSAPDGVNGNDQL